MKFTFIHWLLIFSSGILALVCLFIAIKLFNVEYPITKRNQFIRSLKIGCLVAIFSLIVVFVIGIFIWAETGVFRSLVLALPILCFIPLIVIISVVGTYIQFFWYGRLSKYKDDLAKKQIEIYESHDHPDSPK
jgi:ABC-type spermidine/putrescine transport system permease subunit I